MALKAKFVARYGNFSVGIQSEIAEHYGTGEKRVLKRSLIAQFERSLVSEDDYRYALGVFKFPGLPHDIETEEHVAPRFRISVWDSEHVRATTEYSDEEIDLMITKLREFPQLGTDMVEIVPKPAAMPFPGYDEISVEDVLTVVRVTSLDPELVLAYEREHKNRVTLIEALEGEDDGDSVVVQA